MKTYALEGIPHEFANFVSLKFSVEAIKKTITKENSMIVATYKDNPVGVAEIVFDNLSSIINITENKLFIPFFEYKNDCHAELVEANY